MVEIKIDYQGELHCRAVHGPSGAVLETDAPVDNNGRGEAFSPTDLVATALGVCMATVMGIVAKRKEIDLAGMKVVVKKHMSTDTPRRIARLEVDIEMPLSAGHPDRRLLESTGNGCPVHQSLHPDVVQEIRWHWQEG
jgi:putative redox protein